MIQFPFRRAINLIGPAGAWGETERRFSPLVDAIEIQKDGSNAQISNSKWQNGSTTAAAKPAFDKFAVFIHSLRSPEVHCLPLRSAELATGV